MAPLPKKFEFTLVAHAFDPNIGSDFIVFAGDNFSPFALTDVNEKGVIKLINPQRSSAIRIKVPHPVSPRGLGIGG